MRKLLRHLPNLVIALLIIFLAFKRLPTVFEQYSAEGREAPAFSVPTLDGQKFEAAKLAKNAIIVFWATWCGPCTLELARLNELVEDGSLASETIVAISSHEERALVEKTARERGYRFTIGFDTTGEVAELFKVAGTPTVVFIGKDHKIEWITTGLSPTLGYRARRFLAP